MAAIQQQSVLPGDSLLMSTLVQKIFGSVQLYPWWEKVTNKFLPGAENFDNLNITMEWKKWKSEETLCIQKAFKKITKHGTQEVQCPRCVKIVKVRTFLNHTTKPPGCKQILPEFKLKHKTLPTNSEYKF